MKINGYLNEFCKSIKHFIKKGGYKEAIQKVEKFIERENNLLNFSDDSVIQLLYQQTYCCHKLILKELMESNDHFNRYIVKQLLSIASRNVKVGYKILFNNIKRKQVIINLQHCHQMYENEKEKDRNSQQICEKTFYKFLQAVIWTIKDSSIIIFFKKDQKKLSSLFRSAILFIQSIENAVKKNKIRLRINQLEVKSLYMVHLFRNKQYQVGSQICKKNSTQIFQFVSLLTHKNQSYKRIQQSSRYKKVIKKCYRMLLMTSIYQCYFHIMLGTFHPIQALVSIIKKIEGIQGPKQFIRRYENYHNIVDILQVVIKSHFELHRYFGNGQILSVQAINNIIENGQINVKSCQKQMNIKKSKKSFVSSKGCQILKNHQQKSNPISKSQKKQEKRMSKTYHKPHEIKKSLFDRVEEEKQGVQNNKQDKEMIIKNLVQSKQKRTNDFNNRIQLGVLKENLWYFANNYSQVGNKGQKQKEQKDKIFQKRQSISLNISRCSNSLSCYSKLINEQLVNLFENKFEENLKKKKKYLSKKKLQARKTCQFSSSNAVQYAILDFQNDKNKLWEQFKSNIKQRELQILRENKISSMSKISSIPKGDQFFQYNTNQLSNGPKMTTKLSNFDKNKNYMGTTRVSHDSGMLERKKVIFSFAQRQQLEKSKWEIKKETIFEKFIKILIQNKNNLSILSFALKYESHIKRLQNKRVKQMQKAKIKRQNSTKNILTQKQIPISNINNNNNNLYENKSKINKLNINKMRSQIIIFQLPNQKKTYLNDHTTQPKCRNQPSANSPQQITKKKEPVYENTCEFVNRKYKYVSKYSEIEEDKRILRQIGEQQYQKKLQICYQRSKQSINAIKKKLIQKENKGMNKRLLQYFPI